MSELDPVNDALERLEWQDAREEETPRSRMAAMTRRAALTGGAAAMVSTAIAACGGDGNKPASSKAQSGTSASGIFKSEGEQKFVLVNHVTTNPFFVPTRYGAEDACKLLGCDYQWTGSESANVNEMVNALNSAISSKVDGIAVAIVDLKAFNEPIKRAIDAGIPVVGYNADAPGERLAYIGQDLFVSGQEMGKRIVELVGEGDVAL